MDGNIKHATFSIWKLYYLVTTAVWLLFSQKKTGKYSEPKCMACVTAIISWFWLLKFPSWWTSTQCSQFSALKIQVWAMSTLKWSTGNFTEEQKKENLHEIIVSTSHAAQPFAIGLCFDPCLCWPAPGPPEQKGLHTDVTLLNSLSMEETRSLLL